MSFQLLLSDDLILSEASAMTSRSLFWLIIANEVCHHKRIIFPFSLPSVSLYVSTSFVLKSSHSVLHDFSEAVSINLSWDYSNFCIVKNVILSLSALSSRTFGTRVAYFHSELLELLYYSALSLQKSLYYYDFIKTS